MLVVKPLETDAPEQSVRMTALRGVLAYGREFKAGDEFEARLADAAGIESTGRARVIDGDRAIVFRMVPLW